MSQYFQVHPTHPQARLVRQAVAILRQGGIAAVPTDAAYALVCHLEDRSALERLRRIRGVPADHLFTLLCRDLSELSRFAKVDNTQFRYLKHFLPGAYTFVLKASRDVPRRLLHPKRKTLGLRVAEHPVIDALLAELGEPLLTTTLQLAGEELPLTDGEEIREHLQKHIDVVIDSGHCGIEPTTVVDLTDGEPVVLRQGLGLL